MFTVASMATHTIPAGISTITTTTVDRTTIIAARATLNTAPTSPMTAFADSRARTFERT